MKNYYSKFHTLTATTTAVYTSKATVYGIPGGSILHKIPDSCKTRSSSSKQQLRLYAIARTSHIGVS